MNKFVDLRSELKTPLSNLKSGDFFVFGNTLYERTQNGAVDLYSGECFNEEDIEGVCGQKVEITLWYREYRDEQNR